ncbi:glyoxalase [Paractinoplanes deccanensis]|uniref:Glyoxalase n=1 Tax=Paractinoplanes deccanensis TaxID=113561 RepID=A0ABQ3YAT0_9ACTN|nr:VOC family protein [Actinoplanes deccanensis]GID77035.1 glyoxalase [Actinoplanes deccanensis]
MVDFKIEVVVLPVSDVDAAKEFYERLGWRKDTDYSGADGLRLVAFTPPGSAASIMLGNDITEERPGTAQSVTLVTGDIAAARDELIGKGAEASEIFHDAGGVFHHAGSKDRVAGPHPERRSYSSWFSFTDPDGNLFFVQEVTSRHPGRTDRVVYDSVAAVEQALRDAAAAHGEHEKVLGHYDEQWPSWYAAYMAKAAGLDA